MEEILKRYTADPVEHERYRSVVESLRGLLPYLQGRHLDFGASYGLSMLALLELGIRDVIGVEIDATRVHKGSIMLTDAGADPSRLMHVPDTRDLPFADSSFDTVIANAVFEHIPEPRDAHIREVWRVLRPGGHLIVAETPNKYLPYDFHTTQLWLIPWLPSRVAYAYAVFRGKFRQDEDWRSSGWRGVGYYELVGGVPKNSKVIHEMTRYRHRVLAALGLPTSLLDPYPLIIIEKSIE